MNLRVNTKQQKRLLGIASLAAVAILWQAVADLVVANPFVLPSFTDVVSAFIALLGSGRLLADLNQSQTLRHRHRVKFLLGVLSGSSWAGSGSLTHHRPDHRGPPAHPARLDPVCHHLSGSPAADCYLRGAFFPSDGTTGFRSVPKISPNGQGARVRHIV